MQQHTIHFWTHRCAVLTWTGRWRGGPCLQILSWNFVIKVCHSLNVWCFQDNWEFRKKLCLIMTSGRTSRKRFLTWNFELDDRSKRIFLVGACSFQSSQLSWTHWNMRFPSSEFPVVLNSAEGTPIYSTFSGPWCCVWMFILLSLEKETTHPLHWIAG